jgi:hypothetical protein
VARGLQAALAITHEAGRAEAWSVLAPQIAGQPDQCHFRRLVAAALHEHHIHTTRANLLSFLAIPHLLAPPLFTQPILEAIARHIIEICTEWEWL